LETNILDGVLVGIASGSSGPVAPAAVDIVLGRKNSEEDEIEIKLASVDVEHLAEIQMVFCLLLFLDFLNQRLTALLAENFLQKKVKSIHDCSR
jgi:hypothetical protein